MDFSSLTSFFRYLLTVCTLRSHSKRSVFPLALRELGTFLPHLLELDLLLELTEDPSEESVLKTLGHTNTPKDKPLLQGNGIPLGFDSLTSLDYYQRRLLTWN